VDACQAEQWHVMFNSGGQPSTQHRREVDLYVYTDNVDALHQRLKDRVEVVKGLRPTDSNRS
jgi:NAD-dependent SIR2 family protein deacetylase